MIAPEVHPGFLRVSLPKHASLSLSNPRPPAGHYSAQGAGIIVGTASIRDAESRVHLLPLVDLTVGVHLHQGYDPTAVASLKLTVEEAMKVVERLVTAIAEVEQRVLR
jgi:hypothetical protein